MSTLIDFEFKRSNLLNNVFKNQKYSKRILEFR